jgi:hypothetical protein
MQSSTDASIGGPPSVGSDDAHLLVGHVLLRSAAARLAAWLSLAVFLKWHALHRLRIGPSKRPPSDIAMMWSTSFALAPHRTQIGFAFRCASRRRRQVDDE